MEAEEASPFDFGRITFPSDKLTIADIRRVHPERFGTREDPLPRFFHAREGEDHDKGPEGIIGDMLFIERSLALTAFERAEYGRGVTPVPGLREELIEDLAKLYAGYGIAGRGVHETGELVKHFERQAAAQARGRPR